MPIKHNKTVTLGDISTLKKEVEMHLQTRCYQI